MKNKIYFLLLLILFHIITGNTLKCGHGLLKHKEPGIIKTVSNKRTLTDDEYEPIKIKVDYTQLMIDTKIYPDIFDRIKESLDSAVHYFELLIKIKHYTLQTLSHTTFEDKCSINNVENLGLMITILFYSHLLIMIILLLMYLPQLILALMSMGIIVLLLGEYISKITLILEEII